MAASAGEVRRALDDGHARQALEWARELLRSAPDDPELLALAAEAAVEDADPEALPLARRLREAEPSARAHRLVGLALLAEGEADAAAAALREALALDPTDAAATVSLAHLANLGGRNREATDLMERAAAEAPDDAAIASDLVDLHWMAGRLRKAIVWAERLVELTPDDPLALLDLAELSLELNEHDVAVEAFGRIREVDEEPGRRIFPLHGMIEAHIRAGQLRCALDLAITATEVDREGLTTDALAFVVAGVFGRADHEPPSEEELMSAFAAERARFRRVLDSTGVM